MLTLVHRLTVAILAAVAIGPAARASDGVEDRNKVRVKIVAILATGGDKDDERLTKIAEEIRKIEPGLKGLQVVRMSSEALPVDAKKATTFDLIDEQKVEVTVRRKADGGKVCLVVKPPMAGEIKYSTCCGKFFPIVTRYQTRSRERLIIAVMVPPCDGKEKE